MASTVYPPLTASYPFVQGLNVKTFNIFSQRLIGTVGRNSRSKIVSLKTVVSSSTRGHNLPAGGSGYKIINQSMPGYFDDSLYSQQGVTVEKGSGPATNSYVTIEVLTASWTQTGSPFIEIQVWDNSNLSSGGAEEMTHGTGSGGTEIDGVQRWTNDSSAYTVNDGMFGVYGSETGTEGRRGPGTGAVGAGNQGPHRPQGVAGHPGSLPGARPGIPRALLHGRGRPRARAPRREHRRRAVPAAR